MKFKPGDLVKFISATSDSVYTDVGLVISAYSMKSKAEDPILDPGRFYDIMYSGNLEIHVPEVWLVSAYLLQECEDSTVPKKADDAS